MSRTRDNIITLISAGQFGFTVKIMNLTIPKSKILQTILLLLSIISILAASCSPNSSFSQKIDRIITPYRFNIPGWEAGSLMVRIYQNMDLKHPSATDIASVEQYFTIVNRINKLRNQDFASGSLESAGIGAELADLQAQQRRLAQDVKTIVSSQIQKALAEENIYNPLYQNIKLQITFPPVMFELETPPHLLVISPRDKIMEEETNLLQSKMDEPAMNNIEDRVDALNVSSLVVELGGLAATYPSIVTNDSNLRFIINTAAHEWTHQYLIFTPLGFGYLLDLAGIRPDSDIVEINETVADMIGNEIETQVMEKFYPAWGEPDPGSSSPAFDFNRFMTDLRQQVVALLDQGKISEAENLMEKDRQFLNTKGYNIRKINQAYFAFYGEYADQPGFVSPIGKELNILRSQSGSLAGFLEKVTRVTSRQGLVDSLK